MFSFVIIRLFDLIFRFFQTAQFYFIMRANSRLGNVGINSGM